MIRINQKPKTLLHNNFYYAQTNKKKYSLMYDLQLYNRSQKRAEKTKEKEQKQ